MDPNVSPLPLDVDHLTGPTVARLMRANGRTIESVASAMGITPSRVREVRAKGVQGAPFVWDWSEAITGDPRLAWADIARASLGCAARSMPASQAGQRGRP